MIGGLGKLWICRREKTRARYFMSDFSGHAGRCIQPCQNDQASLAEKGPTNAIGMANQAGEKMLTL
jgi:hypothetical protein